MLCRLFAWMLVRASPDRDPRDPSVVLSGAVVIGWWMLLAGSVALLLPSPAASAPGTPFRPVPGGLAHVDQPGMASWPIPVTRMAFDEYTRGIQESDDAAIDDAFAISEWIEARDRAAVRLVTVDGEVVEIELLDGPVAGRRGWVRSRNLGP